MRLSFIPFILITAACSLTDGVSRSRTDHAAVPLSSCEGSSSGQCAFVNSPVRLGSEPIHLFARKFPFYKTIDSLEFVDAGRQQWVAPSSTLTDGASIPPVFVKIIGDPKSREFINAATVHDAYCGIGNEDGEYYHAAIWQNVHRMFYDALRVGGTPAVKAKIMFAAVYLGGPRWSGVTKNKIRAGKSGTTGVAGARGRVANQSLLAIGIPPQVLRTEMRKAKAYIEANNPSIATLESYLISSEASMADAQSVAEGDDDTPEGSYSGLY